MVSLPCLMGGNGCFELYAIQRLLVTQKPIYWFVKFNCYLANKVIRSYKKLLVDHGCMFKNNDGLSRHLD